MACIRRTHPAMLSTAAPGVRRETYLYICFIIIFFRNKRSLQMQWSLLSRIFNKKKIILGHIEIITNNLWMTITKPVSWSFSCHLPPFSGSGADPLEPGLEIPVEFPVGTSVRAVFSPTASSNAAFWSTLSPERWVSVTAAALSGPKAFNWLTDSAWSQMTRVTFSLLTEQLN